MWELIQANKKKSWLFFLGLGTILLLLGFLIGEAVMPGGSSLGILIAGIIWVVLSLLGFFAGKALLLSMNGAQPAQREIYPQLYNIVEEMKIASSLPVMPEIYVVPHESPNAFAAGIRPDKSVISVTAGLLNSLNRDELQAVIAHEMSHIINRDVLFMTFAGVTLTCVTFISELFLRGFFRGGGGRYGSKRSKGNGNAVIIIVALVFAILAPIIARLFYFAISRKREYLADASAVRLTRYPEGLASALEKISGSALSLDSATRMTAPMYIVNPFKKKMMGLAGLSSTHPPVAERVRILRQMTHGVNLLNYQKAFQSVNKKEASLLPPSALKDAQIIAQRRPSVDAQPPQPKPPHQLGDMLRAMNQYAFLTCACGLKLKIPPELHSKHFLCPRCQRDLQVPLSEAAPVLAGLGTILSAPQSASAAPPPANPSKATNQVYHRQSNNWETFRCACGKPIQLSPSFSGDHLSCPHCLSHINIIQE